MIDIKLIRENPDLVKENIKKKFQDEKLVLVDEVLQMDKEYRAAKTKGDSLRGEVNKTSKQIGMFMRDKNAADRTDVDVHARKRIGDALSADAAVNQNSGIRRADIRTVTAAGRKQRTKPCHRASEIRFGKRRDNPP